jgi:23S rRNA pseudouridine1911/1915/1917 synthase
MGPSPREAVLSTDGLSLVVPAALDGERVDRGLALLAGLSRSQVTRLVKGGHAYLAGRQLSTGGRRLRAGEVLEVDLSAEALAGEDLELSAGGQAEAGESFGPGPLAGAERGSGADRGGLGPGVAQARIVHADQDVVVVDKPAGLVVHPGAGNSRGTLVQQLVALFPDIVAAGPPGERPGIVHRLDKGTSGVLVVARTPAARESLVAQLASREVERRYLTVVYGELQGDEGVIEAPLGRSQSQRTKMAVVEGGRQARTRYVVLDRSALAFPVSLASCRLESGRTHQVRVHLAAIGHPVLADDRYAPAGQLAAARAAVPLLKRPWLHAARLGFTHPTSGRAMSFESPLPADLAAALGALGLALPAQPGAGWPA